MSKPVSPKDLLRKAYRDYWQGYREHTSSSDWPNNGEYPPTPESIRNLTCGAKTRAGTPCKRIDLYWPGRCKFHGGLSTGPKTEAGKAQVRANGKLGGRPKSSKPKPLDNLTKPDTYAGSALPGAGTSFVPEPDPMEVPRFPQGSWPEPANGKPDPMDSSEKLTPQSGTQTVIVRLPNMSPWRAFCAQRGLVLPTPEVSKPSPVVVVGKIHIIPAPRRRRR